MPVASKQIHALVGENALVGTELATRLEQARDKTYWHSLCPGLLNHTTDSPLHTEIAPVCVTPSVEEYDKRGYCYLNDVFSLDQLAPLETAVRTVKREGWPMVFAFLYDPFWTLTRTAKFDAFLRSVTGSNYQTSAIFWVNHVPASPGGSGFSPHRDGKGYGKVNVTCWVPLTPATPDNGCMYIVETNDATTPLLQLEALSKRQVFMLMANTRALPIDPGGLLAWRHDVIHWGGSYRAGAQDRVALSWEIISEDYENIDPELHVALRQDRPLPQFELRLKWVCHAFMRFGGRDPILGRFKPLATEILGSEASKTQVSTANA